MDDTKHNVEVAELYEITSKDYIEAWSNATDLGMHFGLWDKNTRDRHDAIKNENKFVSDVLGIRNGTVVLDAGCGIGGTSIYISRRTGAIVNGITLSKTQVKFATKFAAEQGAKTVSFTIQDFTKTSYPGVSFDYVFAIESSCNSDRRKLIREAYRLLKPGGKLFIADYYRSSKPMGLLQRIFVKWFLQGWKLTPLAKADLIEQNIKVVGFSTVKTIDATSSMIRSSVRLFLMCLMVLIPDIFNSMVRKGILTIEMYNTLASTVQYYLFKKNYLKYIILVAIK